MPLLKYVCRRRPRGELRESNFSDKIPNFDSSRSSNEELNNSKMNKSMHKSDLSHEIPIKIQNESLNKLSIATGKSYIIKIEPRADESQIPIEESKVPLEEGESDEQESPESSTDQEGKAILKHTKSVIMPTENSKIEEEEKSQPPHDQNSGIFGDLNMSSSKQYISNTCYLINICIDEVGLRHNPASPPTFFNENNPSKVEVELKQELLNSDPATHNNDNNNDDNHNNGDDEVLLQEESKQDDDDVLPVQKDVSIEKPLDISYGYGDSNVNINMDMNVDGDVVHDDNEHDNDYTDAYDKDDRSYGYDKDYGMDNVHEVSKNQCMGMYFYCFL